MQVYNALQLKKGAKAKQNRLGVLPNLYNFYQKKVKMMNGQLGTLIG